ncbi:MAG: fibrobacter succinogenes major paralogous domain-containing protein [Patescibacteria group bacterium]
MKTLILLLLLAVALASCQSCDKDKTLPGVVTSPVSSITNNSVISGGRVTDDGNAKIIACGLVYGSSSNITINGPKTSEIVAITFSSQITSLEAGKTYCVRAYATNEVGTSYGEAISFQTSGATTNASTLDATNIEFGNATLNGSVTTDNGQTEISFIYGENENNLDRIISVNPTKGVITYSASAVISGLNKSTVYYFAIKAVNNYGTSIGGTKSFKTFEGSASDIDGNVYKTVKIGNQVWMTENLRVNHYNDGTEIPNVTDGNTWATLTSGAWCDYKNDPANGKVYGHLYNWFTVDTKKLAPQGYHVPSYEELVALADFVIQPTGGGKLREIGTAHWPSPNADATNETGFTALPNGQRSSDEHNGGIGNFSYLNELATFWSATKLGDPLIGMLNNFYPEALTFGTIFSQYGNGVRLIKD